MGAPISPPSEPHPDIVPYLLKYQISWEDFVRRMIRDERINEIRSRVVTELHSQGMPWAKMTLLTSFGAGQLQGYSKAVGNENSLKNRQENARKTGKAGAGKKKPTVSEDLRKRWARGDFDFHKGRVRSEDERENLRRSYTEERREKVRTRLLSQWKEEGFRNKLLLFHRSEEERSSRSSAQAARMRIDPRKWTFGKGRSVFSSKNIESCEFWVRSSFEVAAVALLDEDPSVSRFVYEPIFSHNNRKCVPDFLVTYTDNSQRLIEVKASWRLRIPKEHPWGFDPDIYQSIADEKGIPFEIWTELGVLNGHV
jgi:hypothetical protein